MAHHPLRLRAIAATVAVVALGAPLVADAASSRDTLVRDRISSTTKQGNVQSGVSASFFRPATWKLTSHTSTSRTYQGPTTPACGYIVAVSTLAAPDKAQTAAAHVAEALPVPNEAYVIESGTRNASAWRIVRERSTSADPRVRVNAMLAIRRSYGTGQKAWHETRVTAVSRPGDECHSGTWRDTLRTHIGDLLATTNGRIYRFTSR
jgi:hypothetical protein